MKEAAEDEARARAAAEQEEFERELLQLRWEVKRLKLEHELWCFEQKYSPNQPRVPAGSPQGGQWTNGSGETAPVRLAAADTPRLGPASMRRLALQLAKRLIEAYRSENFLSDLFGRKAGTVTYANIDGKDFFGSNSTSPMYTSRDDAAARNMREVLLQKYPDLMEAIISAGGQTMPCFMPRLHFC